MSKTEKKIVQERIKIPSHGDIKIEESKGALQQMRESTQQKITQIRVDTEETDKLRRTTEERSKKERANKI